MKKFIKGEYINMSFTVTFPVNIGEFVIIDYKKVNLNDPKNLLKRFGTISCYQDVTDYNEEYVVMVSGYKDAWCRECFLSEVLVATDEQINMYKKEMGIDDNKTSVS